MLHSVADTAAAPACGDCERAPLEGDWPSTDVTGCVAAITRASPNWPFSLNPTTEYCSGTLLRAPVSEYPPGEEGEEGEEGSAHNARVGREWRRQRAREEGTDD